MIISASRRTDLPAFYSKWFINRIHAGYCTVPNPFNLKQVSYVSLRPEDVEVIVFWTRNPQPLAPYLKELSQLGYRYYFQFTVVDYEPPIEKNTPPLAVSLSNFISLVDLIGPEKVIWRYDPILITEKTDLQFHIDKYEQIAVKLRGYTKRSIISIADIYPKVIKRLGALIQLKGVEELVEEGNPGRSGFSELVRTLGQIARENGMDIFSCAETIYLSPYGVPPGKCIDDDLIEKIFHIAVTHTKDPSQRKACGCVINKDIGMYDTCLFGCQYCYATSDFDRARINHKEHNPNSPSLIGWHEVEPESKQLR